MRQTLCVRRNHRPDGCIYIAGGKHAGSRLYAHSEIDHERLFSICEKLRGDFLMTYDNAEEVCALAGRHGLETKSVPMKNTHHAEMTELLIGRNLDWVEDGGIFREEPPAYKTTLTKEHKNLKRK